MLTRVSDDSITRLTAAAPLYFFLGRGSVVPEGDHGARGVIPGHYLRNDAMRHVPLFFLCVLFFEKAKKITFEVRFSNRGNATKNRG